MTVFLMVVFVFISPIGEVVFWEKALPVENIEQCEALRRQEDFTGNLIKAHGAIGAFMYCEIPGEDA